MKTDVVIGFFFGDEGKAKVVNDLLSTQKYNRTLRFNGGANAGHTLYKDGQKIITHMVPVGALYGIRSIIGPGCVVNEKGFFKELEELSKVVPNVSDYVKIANNTHVVLDKHIEEEEKETKLGTTKRGIGPTYRDKYARLGIRAEEVSGFSDYLVDIYDEFFSSEEEIVMLCEGAQALMLDIDWGVYPYVTSSHCGIGSVINNGVPYTSLDEIIGVGKCYDTYVGSREFQDKENKELVALATLGKEFGATTGRLRQTNYFNLDTLVKSSNMSSATQVVLNKIDILRELDIWKLYFKNELLDMKDEDSFKNIILENLPGVKVIFSDNPYHI